MTFRRTFDGMSNGMSDRVSDGMSDRMPDGVFDGMFDDTCVVFPQPVSPLTTITWHRHQNDAQHIAHYTCLNAANDEGGSFSAKLRAK